LLPQLKHPDRYRRSVVVRGLGQFGTGEPEVLPALESVLQDPVSSVRMAAAETLGGLRPATREVVALLRKYLKDPDVQREAARALGKIGALSRPALPALRKLAEKHPKDTAYRKAIERIEM